MILVEEVKHDTKRELHLRERYWLEELNATLNKTIPSRSLIEYSKNNTEKIKKLHADYYKNNTEKENKRHAEYRKNNTEKEKKQSAEYRKNNTEKIKQCKAEYRKNNAEKLKQKLVCYCGCKYTIWRKTRHFKTKKHNEWITAFPFN